MPLFEIKGQSLKPVKKTNVKLERELQSFIEKNLATIFNCRFVASEFFTGQTHAGRIDTLALSEDNNPVIIEYKKVESSELINQSLFYLNWIYDHKGDYEIAARSAIGNDIKVDWSDVRVICIAPNFRKYDLHAVQVMGANIELWSYRLFENNTLYLEQIYGKNYLPSPSPVSEINTKNPVMVAAGKKAAATRLTGSYTFDQHIQGKPEKIKNLARAIQDYLQSLDSTITENPKKFYVAYKTSQNIVCLETKNTKIMLWLKLDPTKMANLPDIARDVSAIGHPGTGDLELAIKNADDLEIAKPFIEQAYKLFSG